jgi:aryl-alcohol dehydrogenase-like predicted oxidoreductase
MGCQFFDTADTYCEDGNDLHYAERLFDEALTKYHNQDIINGIVSIWKLFK